MSVHFMWTLVPKFSAKIIGRKIALWVRINLGYILLSLQSFFFLPCLLFLFHTKPATLWRVNSLDFSLLKVSGIEHIDFIPWGQLSTANSSCVTEFLLLDFSSLGELQLVLFVVFLCFYLIILSGNITIISIICLDHSLHTPMYFFLCVLSTSETF